MTNSVTKKELGQLSVACVGLGAFLGFLTWMLVHSIPRIWDALLVPGFWQHPLVVMVTIGLIIAGGFAGFFGIAVVLDERYRRIEPQ